MQNVKQFIEQQLNDALTPVYLEVLDESHMHNVPPGSESHFKLVVVTGSFEGVPRVRRQQTVNSILKDELAGPLHALSMETLTPEEWEKKAGVVRQSPDCLGGSKFDG